MFPFLYLLSLVNAEKCEVAIPSTNSTIQSPIITSSTTSASTFSTSSISIMSASSTTSTATSSPSPNPFDNVSAECKSAMKALDLAPSSCPIKDTFGSFLDSQSSGLNNTIQVVCGNPACKNLANSFSDLFTNGVCSRDTIDFSNLSGLTGKSANISVTIFGFFSSTNYALTCQKTSDNKGYCGASPSQKPVITSLAVAPFMPGLGIPSNITITQLISLNSKSDVCTDCSKNGLATVLADTKLSGVRSSVQNVSSELDSFCGNSYSSVPGIGGL